MGQIVNKQEPDWLIKGQKISKKMKQKKVKRKPWYDRSQT